MANKITGLAPAQKRFIDLFQPLTYRHSAWQVWSDFIEMTAVAIANRTDARRRAVREDRYLSLIGKYDPGEQAVFPRLIGSIALALEENPEQDFLGDLFMRLELGSHWKGQFFTPYSVCRVMAQMQVVDMPARIAEKGFVSVNDPACGAGATLIAFANESRSRGINFQQHVLFAGQDIDQTAGLMCYIQLSFLGCPGYVLIGDSLREPVTAAALTGPNVWYTPFYFTSTWHFRRTFAVLDAAIASMPAPRERKGGEIEQLTLF
ncbi:N-6 DNA methylase [Saccharibacillus brassicae]|uniref:site-specific DNA-methyltransferase (adenine-specific) n=1 Tax=Saccharibacillus brassicae TaxID=2583377 RepID=A0A4Y6V4B3_SACBS|nr:N-6 DNA methylase [Saccharibacillus brassicae]QDH23481.1 SAM-dependent DNA methyltransferase [Saccharibacillus brassicae]